MEKLMGILTKYQDESWFYDIRIEESIHNEFIASYDEYDVEIIVKSEFTISDLLRVVSELKDNGYNVESFFECEERGIKDTYLVRFGVWRR